MWLVETTGVSLGVLLESVTEGSLARKRFIKPLASAGCAGLGLAHQQAVDQAGVIRPPAAARSLLLQALASGGPGTRLQSSSPKTGRPPFVNQARAIHVRKTDSGRHAVVWAELTACGGLAEAPLASIRESHPWPLPCFDWQSNCRGVPVHSEPKRKPLSSSRSSGLGIGIGGGHE